MSRGNNYPSHHRNKGEWIAVARGRDHKNRDMRSQFRCVCGRLTATGQAAILTHFATKCR